MDTIWRPVYPVWDMRKKALDYSEEHPDYWESEQVIAYAVTPSNRFQYFVFCHPHLRFINSVFLT